MPIKFTCKHDPHTHTPTAKRARSPDAVAQDSRAMFLTDAYYTTETQCPHSHMSVSRLRRECAALCCGTKRLSPVQLRQSDFCLPTVYIPPIPPRRHYRTRSCKNQIDIIHRVPNNQCKRVALHLPAMLSTDRGRNVDGSLLRVICAAHVLTPTTAMALFERSMSSRDVYASRSPWRSDVMAFMLRLIKYTPEGMSVGTCCVARTHTPHACRRHVSVAWSCVCGTHTHTSHVCRRRVSVERSCETTE